MKIFKIVCWLAVLCLHWAFIQNDFLNIDEEEETIEICFDVPFFLVWFVGFLPML